MNIRELSEPNDCVLLLWRRRPMLQAWDEWDMLQWYDP